MATCRYTRMMSVGRCEKMGCLFTYIEYARLGIGQFWDLLKMGSCVFIPNRSVGDAVLFFVLLHCISRPDGPTLISQFLAICRKSNRQAVKCNMPLLPKGAAKSIGK